MLCKTGSSYLKIRLNHPKPAEIICANSSMKTVPGFLPAYMMFVSFSPRATFLAQYFSPPNVQFPHQNERELRSNLKMFHMTEFFLHWCYPRQISGMQCCIFHLRFQLSWGNLASPVTQCCRQNFVRWIFWNFSQRNLWSFHEQKYCWSTMSRENFSVKVRLQNLATALLNQTFDQQEPINQLILISSKISICGIRYRAPVRGVL